MKSMAEIDLAIMEWRLLIEMIKSPPICLFEMRLNLNQSIWKSKPPKPAREETKQVPLSVVARKTANERKEAYRLRREKIAEEDQEIERRIKEHRDNRESIPEYNYIDARKIDNPGIFESFQSNSSVINKIWQDGYIHAFQVS